MNYWATAEDPNFCQGHYVEDWEIERLEELSEPVRAFLVGESQFGNKIKSINKLSAELTGPPTHNIRTYLKESRSSVLSITRAHAALTGTKTGSFFACPQGSASTQRDTKANLKAARLRLVRAVRPNPSLKLSPNGVSPSPVWRYAVHFRQPGPGVLPLSPA